MLVAAPAFAQNRFVPGIEDLPLMPQLSAVQGENVVFEAPAGRIVEAWADGATSADAVREFYGKTLPQLGWRSSGPDLFRRENETLRLEFPASSPRGGASAGRILVRFYLAPG
jgi:hypothetical protein